VRRVLRFLVEVPVVVVVGVAVLLSLNECPNSASPSSLHKRRWICLGTPAARGHKSDLNAGGDVCVCGRRAGTTDFLEKFGSLHFSPLTRPVTQSLHFTHFEEKD